jgi:predicted Zn-dependent protease
MSRIRTFERKIRHYLNRLSNYRFKEKLKSYVVRIGILSPLDEIELVDPNPTRLLLPCNLGILFCGDFRKKEIHEKIVHQLENVYDSFFFNIIDLGNYRFSKKMLSRGIKREKFRSRRRSNAEKIPLHPTNKFYQVLIDKRIENKLDMIIAITNLPIYSSEDDLIFLFGETHLDHKTCVVSSLLLKEQFYNEKRNEKLFQLRLEKEAVHEIGHILLGRKHCQNETCVMRKSKTVEEIDFKSIYLCLNCKEKLENLRHKFNF